MEYLFKMCIKFAINTDIKTIAHFALLRVQLSILKVNECT